MEKSNQTIPQPTEAYKRKIRLLFIGVFFYLASQAAMVILKTTEPYPAIRFPGFDKVPMNNKKEAYTRFDVYAFNGKDSVLINNGDLFKRSFVPAIMANILKKSKTTQPNDKKYRQFGQWLQARLQQKYHQRFDRVTISKLSITDTDASGPYAVPITKVVQATTIVFN